jgi:hypothetical protein
MVSRTTSLANLSRITPYSMSPFLLPPIETGLFRKCSRVPVAASSVLVDQDDNCLDRLIAPPFEGGVASHILKGFREARQLGLIIKPEAGSPFSPSQYPALARFKGLELVPLSTKDQPLLDGWQAR